MVNEVCVLPEGTANKIYEKAGEVSMDSVKAEFTEERLRELRSEALHGPDDVFMIADMEPVEWEIVNEAVEGTDEHPVHWLTRAFMETAEKDPVMVGETSAEELLERAVFDMAEV